MLDVVGARACKVRGSVSKYDILMGYDWLEILRIPDSNVALARLVCYTSLGGCLCVGLG